MGLGVSRYEHLLEYYADIEASLPVRMDPSLADLVVPTGNDREPFHRWFRVKEAFSHLLTPRLVDELGLTRNKSIRVLDPFCGSGTGPLSTLVLGKDHGGEVDGIGFEVNPYLYLLAATKCRAATRGVRGVREALMDIADRSRRAPRSGLVRPELSTFSRPEFFPPAQLESLLVIAREVASLERDTPRRRFLQDLALVALGSIVEGSSKLRRDGRTMRFFADRILDDPFAMFEKSIDVIASDIESNDASDGGAAARLRILRGDGRRACDYKSVLGPGTVDLVCFSPPYPNNIDYTEVYKLEAWIIGAYGSSYDFRRQRLKTLRSHPSVSFPEKYPSLAASSMSDRIRPMVAAIPADRYRLQRERLVRGYADDMIQTLRNLKPLLKPDGRIVYVVANSLHGRGETSFLFASDLIISEAARTAGLVVEDFRIARQLHRRGMGERLLRESVVVLRAKEMESA